MSRSHAKVVSFPDDGQTNERELASDPGVLALASLSVPGELEEWGDPEERAQEDHSISEDLAPLRRQAAELSR